MPQRAIPAARHRTVLGRLRFFSDIPEDRTGSSRRRRRGRRRHHRVDGGVPARRRRKNGRAARTREMRPDRHRSHQRAPDDGDRRAARRLVNRFGRDTRAGRLGRRTRRDRADRFHHPRARDRLRVRVGGRLPPRARRRGPTPSKPTHVQRGGGARERLGFDARVRRGRAARGRARRPFEAQARFHPRKYLAGLARAITARAGRSTSTAKRKNSATSRSASRPTDCTLTCDDIVVATHNPLVGVASIAERHAVPDQARALHELRHRRTGAAGRGSRRALLGHRRPVSLPEGRAPPRSRPGHLRRRGSQDRTGVGHDRLLRPPRAGPAALVPDVDITHRWSGQVIETPDGLPYIGRTADHQYAATGFGGQRHDVRHAGRDDRLGRDSRAAESMGGAVRSGRAAVRRGLWEYIKENADYPYYLIRDRFAGAEGAVAARGEARPGQGDRARRREGRRVPRRQRRDRPAVGDLHAHGVRRGVE